jgi:mono/diheme cytochrome c family protein
MTGWVRALLGALLLTFAGLWWLSRPLPLDSAAIPAHTASLENGERLFYAGGCASCHGEEADGGALRLGGGLALHSPYGTFHAPNISPDPEHGIGRWSDLDFANAMLRGVSPVGTHYYPSFPYTSYTRMQIEDVLDLKAFLDSLPAVDRASAPHELNFPYSLRRLLGLWKRLYLDPSPVVPVAAGATQLQRGRYLVEGAGHCGECHTPRKRLGVLDRSTWLSGAPSLEGEGKVPAITPAALSDWSHGDLAYYLESGIDPEFDVVGGSMARVQENLARLTEEDRAAIATYLKRTEQP